MLQISLNEDELVTLRDILHCCLTELRFEIHHTDDMDFKDMLKNRKFVLEKILGELSINGELSESNC